MQVSSIFNFGFEVSCKSIVPLLEVRFCTQTVGRNIQHSYKILNIQCCTYYVLYKPIGPAALPPKVSFLVYFICNVCTLFVDVCI
jgi:hypothetical protein